MKKRERRGREGWCWTHVRSVSGAPSWDVRASARGSSGSSRINVGKECQGIESTRAVADNSLALQLVVWGLGMLGEYVCGRGRNFSARIGWRVVTCSSRSTRWSKAQLWST